MSSTYNLVLFFVSIPIFLALGQWTHLLNDFSNPTTHPHPHAPLVQDHRVSISENPFHKWIQILTPSDNKCMDLGSRALLVTYHVHRTGPRIIEFHQKSSTCSTTGGSSFIAEMVFYASQSQIVIPLTSFTGANLTLGHAFVFRGPLTLYRLELVHAAEAYGPDLPTSLTMLPGAHVNPAMYTSIHVGPGNFVGCARDDYGCFDLTGKLIRVTYSSAHEGLRKLSFLHRLFIRENPVSNTNVAFAMFSAGYYVHAHVPACAFTGANLKLGVEVRIHGPLTVHQIEIVDGPVSTAPQPNVPDHETLLVDEFTENSTSNNLGFSRFIYSYTLDPSGPYTFLTENLALETGSLDMEGMSFQIMYTAPATVFFSITVSQWRSMGSTTRITRRRGTIDTEIRVRFIAGANVQAIIPIAAFQAASPVFDPSLVCSISFQGMFTLHRLHVIRYTPLGLPPVPAVSPPVPDEAVIGTPVVLFDSKSYDCIQIVALDRIHGIFNPVSHIPGDILLNSADQYVTVNYTSETYDIDEIAHAFRITYSVSKTLNHTMTLLGKDRPPSSVFNKSTRIQMETGTLRQLVVPLTALQGSKSDYQLRIQGPLQIQRIELVTTLQYTTHQRLQPYPTLLVARSSVYADAYAQIPIWAPVALRSPLSVGFVGEDGSDSGGLSREFFTLISQEIPRHFQSLLHALSDTNYLMNIDPDSGSVMGHLSKFKFLGRILGLAYVRKCLIRVRLSPVIFKMVFHHPLVPKDLLLVEPAIYQSFQNLVEQGSVDDAGLTMSGEYPLSNGSAVAAEFVEAGSSVPVTRENMDTFMHMYAQWRIHDLVKPQVDALRHGIMDAVPRHVYCKLKWNTFGFAIAGRARIDVADWKAATNYLRFKPTDETVALFWKCVEQWSDAERAKLLLFVTGSIGVPATGFAALDGGPFTLFKVDDLGRYPAPHTCINQLDLPPYTDLHVMQERLRVAMLDMAFNKG